MTKRISKFLRWLFPWCEDHMIGFIGGTIVTWLVLLILSIVLSSFGVSACL